MQPLYVLPSDGVDQGIATDGTLTRSLAAMQAWLASQAHGERLRITPGPVAVVRLPQSDADISSAGIYVRDRVEELLRGLGYTDARRIYAVWYDGTSVTSCGGGAWPPALVGHVAALYLRGRYGSVDCSLDAYSADGVHAAINDLKMLHEIMHTLGLVPACAPHQTREGHTSDSPNDLMWAGDGVWNPSVLDVGHDDYYSTGRTDCPDLANSGFLTPLPAHPESPPGW